MDTVNGGYPRPYDPAIHRLPHPDVPCAWCGRYVMGEEACPNAKDICIDCCDKWTGEHA